MGGESVKGFGTEWIEGGVKSGRCCRGCLLSEWSIDAYAPASQVLVLFFYIFLCIRSVQLHRNVQQSLPRCRPCHKQDVVMNLICHPRCSACH